MSLKTTYHAIAIAPMTTSNLQRHNDILQQRVVPSCYCCNNSTAELPSHKQHHIHQWSQDVAQATSLNGRKLTFLTVDTKTDDKRKHRWIRSRSKSAQKQSATLISADKYSTSNQLLNVLSIDDCSNTSLSLSPQSPHGLQLPQTSPNSRQCSPDQTIARRSSLEKLNQSSNSTLRVYYPELQLSASSRCSSNHDDVVNNNDKDVRSSKGGQRIVSPRPVSSRRELSRGTMRFQMNEQLRRKVTNEYIANRKQKLLPMYDANKYSNTKDIPKREDTFLDLLMQL